MLAFCLALFLAVAGGQAMAGGKQDFVLVNKTGYTIRAVYVSPSSSNNWEEDVMGRDVLANGASVRINFSRGTSTCNWDLKVDWDDGSEPAIWEGFNLCSVSKITIKYNRNKDETWAEYE
jgi:hypothetical protein